MKHRLIELMGEKQKRDRRMITPDVVASEAGIHPNTMKNWMRGQLKRVDTGTTVKLLRYFDKTEIGDLVYVDWNDTE
jgi:hypothetical protein